MSIKLLKYPSSYHEIHDDLESHLWVLTFIALHRFKQTDPADFKLDFFSEISFPDRNGQGQFPVGGDKKIGVLVDGRLRRIKFVSPAVVGLIKELTQCFMGYSILPRAPGASPLPGPLQVSLDTQCALIGDPKNIIAIFNRWLEGPQFGWQVDDMEAVDKYPHQSNVQTTTQDARSETKSVVVRSSENGHGVCSWAQGSANRLSNQADYSGSHSHQYGYANMSDLSSSRPRHWGLASSYLSYLPPPFSPDVPLPNAPITPFSQPSSHAADIPKSTKRPLDIDEEHETSNKKVKRDAISGVDNNSLDIIARNEDLDEELPSWRHMP